MNWNLNKWKVLYYKIFILKSNKKKKILKNYKKFTNKLIYNCVWKQTNKANTRIYKSILFAHHFLN